MGKPTTAMNLHAIASAAIAVVNPMVPVTVKVATGGYTVLDDGTRVPSHDTLTDVPAQIQALSFSDIQMVSGLQLNGERRAIYLNGRFDSMNRVRDTGGDLITFPDGDVWPYGTTWLVAMVLEQWPDWCKLACTLQVKPPAS